MDPSASSSYTPMTGASSTSSHSSSSSRAPPPPHVSASYLARIHGSEDDKKNCPFYLKVGACRHGDKCNRIHERPLFSCTVVFPGLWTNVNKRRQAASADPNSFKPVYTPEDNAEFQDFFEEVFDEIAKVGEVEDFVVCENTAEHLLGHVFVKFYDEEDARKCIAELTGRYYNGRQLRPEYSPVTNLYDAGCRQSETGTCARGLMCNFQHVRRLPGHAEYLKEVLGTQPHHGVRSGELKRQQQEEQQAQRYGRDDRDDDRRRHGNRREDSRDRYDDRRRRRSRSRSHERRGGGGDNRGRR